MHKGILVFKVLNLFLFHTLPVVFANAPIILYGGKYVYRALKDYVDNDGKRFVAKNIGVESDIWKDE